jgi:cytochrome c5
MNEDLKGKLTYTLVGFLLTIFLISIVFACWNFTTNKIIKAHNQAIETPIINSGIETGEVLPLDTARYEEIRYVNAKQFSSSQLYGLHCKLCHGVDGSGTGPVTRYHNGLCPADLTKHVDRTDQHVYYVILNGTENMPDATKPVAKHVLTNDDIWMVVYHVKTLQKE